MSSNTDPTNLFHLEVDSLTFDDQGELTIASGVITVTGSHHSVDTESDGASDNLDQVSGLAAGQWYAFVPASASRTVVIRDASVAGGAANIYTQGQQSISLAESTDMVIGYSPNGTSLVIVASRTQAESGPGAAYVEKAGDTMTGALRLNDNVALELGTTTSDASIQSTGSAVTFSGADITGGGAGAATVPITVETGDRTKNDADAGVPGSGSLTLRSGTTSQTTAAATGPASGAVSVRSGATDITIAAGTGGASGAITMRSGDTDISAAVAATGGASGAASFGSGNALSTGAGATSGASGAVTLSSGSSADAGTGAVTIESGVPSATGTSGDVTIRSGNPTGAGVSGSISITTGATTGGTRGSITLTGASVAVNNTSGNLVLDNQSTTGATNLDLGTDTSATRAAIRNNSGSELFAVQGDGTTKFSSATGITAFAGGGQASATQLVALFNEITTCATAGDSAKLPAAVAGLKVVVKNNGVAAADIFPGSSDSLNGLAADAAIRVPAGCVAEFYCVDATVWETGARNSLDLISVAAGAAHTNSTDEAVLASRTIAANRLQAGTRVRVSWGARVTADNGATTLTGRLRLGDASLSGTELCVTGAVDTSNGHWFSGEFEFVARAAPGATVAITGRGFTSLGAVGASGAAFVQQALPPTNFVTNGALILEVTADWSAADANSVQMEYFNVEIL